MIGWAFEALIASTVLMVLVLLVRAPVRRYFGPGIAYALWALPAIRLVLPPLPQLPSWREATAEPLAQQASDTITYYVIEPLGGSTAAPSILPQIGLALAGLWVVGAAVFIAWHAVSHWRFCRRMLAHSTHSELSGNVEVIETEAASGPLAFGIFRRYVAFPRDFAERYDAEERELALLHELGHHQRGDLISNWIALAVLAAHWFNPLAWRAFRAFRADQEMANDARVLAGRSAIDRHTYACAIVKAAHGGAVSAACHLHTIQDLKGRLKMLTTGRRSRLRLTLGGTAVAALMFAGLAGTASGTAAANTVRAGVEKATGIDFAQLDDKLKASVESAQTTQSSQTVETTQTAQLGQTAPKPAPAPGAGAGAGDDDLPPPPPPPAGAFAPPPAPGAVPPPPAAGAVPPVPPVPGMVMIRRPDGQTRVTTRQILIRDKDGNVRPAGPGDLPAIPQITTYRVERVVRMDKDGKRVTMDNFGPEPMVITMNCNRDGKGGPDPMVQNSMKDGKRLMVICQNRIDAMAARASAEAMKAKDYKRMAYGKALAGLRSARSSIAANSSMSAEDKARALADIDSSIRDMEHDADRD